jgi:predicted dehydrogenase
MKKIGVGVIGAGTGGWAAISHIPALKSLPDYELRAISTSRRESADAAAKELGVEASFDNPGELIAHPGVDVVVVAVKITEHLELVSAALDAGKTVYSEWPLGRNLAEATELAERAGKSGVRTVVGLQGRFVGAVRHARELIDGGYVGKVLGTTLVASGMAWGPEVDRAHAYWYDNANGASALTISGLHALDALHFVLGEFESVSANLVTARTEVKLIEDGGTIPVTTPDQVAVIGTLRGGAAASVFYRGGISRGDNLRWEINGSEGDLVLSATGVNGNLQTADLRLAGGRGADRAVAEIVLPGESAGPRFGVARMYAQLARDIREGTHTVPDFAHALERHRLVDAIERASRTGSAQPLVSKVDAT